MAGPARKLKLLIVEDSPDDAGLIIRILKKNNFSPEFLIVETENDFINALKKKNWELILSDYSLPQFSGLEAFRIFRESNLDIPFILVSGAIGEEAAVEAMKEGIQDYIMKNKLERLVPAIERELKESLIRQEKIAAEETLQSERKKFVSLANLSPFGLMIIQNDGTINYMNPRIVEYFGYERSKLKTLTEFINCVFPEQAENQWSRDYFITITHNIKGDYDSRPLPAVCRDGSVKYISFKSGPIDQQSYFLIVEDITLHHMAMEALEENQKRLWQIIQSIDDIIVEIKDSGTGEFLIISVNNAFERTTGLLRESVLNKPISTVFPSNLDLKDNISRVLLSRKIYGWECTFNTGEKEVTWDLGIAPIFSDQGDLLRLILSAHDMTERKKSELNLSESEARFRLIASLASDAIWEWYVDIDSILWNEGLFTLFGYKSDEIDNRMSWVRKKIHFNDREKFNQSLERAFRERSDYLTLEFKFECADRTFKVVNSKVNIFYHPDSRPSRLLGAMIDLTQRKQIEELRIQSLVEGADNEREQIARELHDNLSQNLTLASILLQSVKENKENIQDKILQSERIVTQVLNDTRNISHSLMPKTLDDFGLAAAVENLVEHVGKGLKMQIRTYFNFGEGRFPKPVEVNMFRIIQESVNNSIKHSGATEIHISISQADKELTLMIEDNGKGFKLDEPRLRKGIGLKNIENRVIYMNGKLTMESQPGRGTLVIVQIPL
ncbi:MAG TPA: PAS domain S-box protein [Cyclobacteriaceae bacterium]|nr:PAS domain S-box protein [Cyclobacteriaceae bacterium]